MKLPSSFHFSDFDLTGPRRTLPDAALKDEHLRYLCTLSDAQVLQLRQLSKEKLKIMSLKQLKAVVAQSEH